MSNPKRSYNFLRIKIFLFLGSFLSWVAVELAPFGNIEIDGDKYPQDLSYSVSTVYCETPEEKWNPSPDIHLVPCDTIITSLASYCEGLAGEEVINEQLYLPTAIYKAEMLIKYKFTNRVYLNC
ncbi:hypothetical protein Avbf_14285 [Armadillidium vulgare]|nr:hypothetical protein Avbf_14285 [Armadillidium vulgare]